jgi:hypothetical protein
MQLPLRRIGLPATPFFGVWPTFWCRRPTQIPRSSAMTNADPLPPTVLSRKAVVYVLQSTQTQVQVHLESQRRQYDLVDEARRRRPNGSWPCRCR